MSLSIIILTKNENENIENCISHCFFADELIIIDDYSTDNTIQVIKSLKSKKVKIFQRNLNEDFSSQRNFGLEEATSEWIMFVDADEEISKSLEKEILNIISLSDTKQNGFYIPRVDMLWGKKITHGELYNFKILRLAKKDLGKWVGKVHETWNLDGRIGTLKNELIHNPHASVKEFLFEINFYTNIRAQELFDRGVKTNLFFILLYTKAKFFLNYFVKLGFLDGVEGLILAILMSYHSFLVRAKLYMLWKKSK